MTTQQIEYVLALAEQGSFSKAAREYSLLLKQLVSYGTRRTF